MFVKCVDSLELLTLFNYIHDDIDFNPSEILIILFYINSPKLLKHLTVKPNQHRI